jgi:hypothetical protein
MKKLASSILGYCILGLVLFAVLFDPTEMGLGNKFITLSDGILAIAEVLGNTVWLVGILWLIIAFGSLMCLFSNDIFKEGYNAEKLKDTSFFKAISRKPWYEVPKQLLFLGFAIIALGSGFWFTGSTWIFSLIFTKALLNKMRNDKTLALED